MSDDFTPASAVGTPQWAGQTVAVNTFVPVSATGFTQTLGGYGEGGFGEGGYGDNSETIAIRTDLNTQWTPVTNK